MTAHVTPEDRAYHQQQAELARAAFIAGMTPTASASDWSEAIAEAQGFVNACLAATANLTDIASGLAVSASHIYVLRHLLAPPASQDRFALMCPGYQKSAENLGRAITPARAVAIADSFHTWRDRGLTSWLDDDRPPTPAERKLLMRAVSPLMASQRVNTIQRNRWADFQEQQIVELLLAKGWIRLPSASVANLTVLPARHFMRKTRFATKQRPQEVDIACGLGETVVLAMECKVTNDETNSIKRVNDVLKKAKAWQDHWGSFVRTAALLKGVVRYHDVERLLTSDVRVFWSHDLDRFEAWIDDPA